ncbi:MAG: hypothetical protein IJH99_02125 [Eubacterium sp.]|nr:hypothetical protein [Eubacterium sp.]
MKRRITALILAVCMAAGAAACTKKDDGGSKGQEKSTQTESQTSERSAQVQSQSSEGSETSSSSSGQSVSEEEAYGPVLTYSTNKVIPDYYHYEDDAYIHSCDRMAEAAEQGNAEEALDLYDRLHAGALAIVDLDYAVYLQYSRDVSDEYLSDEVVYADDMETEAVDYFLTCCHEMTESPVADDFLAHIGKDAYQAYVDYESIPDKVFELYNRESVLEDEYNTIIADLTAYSTTYKGKTVTLEDMYSGDAWDVYGNDRNALYSDYLELSKELNNDAGAVYVQLVELRKEIAKEYGYDSYVDFCYENVYGRDYTGSDSQIFCDAIKADIAPEFGAVVYDYLGDSLSDEMSYTPDDYLDYLKKFLSKMSPDEVDVLETLKKDNLLDMEYGQNRMNSSYTIDNYTNQSGYIFIDCDKTFSDFITLTHEFGHFSHALLVPAANPLTDMGNYDVLEIHSTGLEYMMTAYYEDILPIKSAEEYVNYEMINGLYSVVTGCLYDEFQRRIYDSRIEMDLNDINNLFMDLVYEYGCEDLFDENDWIMVSHNFDSPLYYISYAVSTLSALEIWEISRHNPKRAVDIWKTVLLSDDTVETYGEIIEKAGLSEAFDREKAESICRNVLEALESGHIRFKKAA